MASHQLVSGRPETLDDPTDLDRGDYKAALKRTIAEIKKDDVPGLASGVAFRMFLSLFPSLLAGVAIFSLVTSPAEIADMLEEASAFIPNDALSLIEDPIRDLGEGGGGAAGFAAIGGIAAGLWAATSAAVSLMKALSRAYDTEETRKFVKQRLHGLALTVALIVALAAMVLLLIAGPQLQAALLPGVVAPVTWLLAGLRFALALGVLVLLFAFVYYLGPDREQPSWAWISPGAVLAVVGWLAVAGGFTLYVQTAGNYNETYGAIAGVVVLLLWLQLSMLVILVGAEFNAEIERTRALHIAVGEGAGFAAPAGVSPGVPADQERSATVLQQTRVSAHHLDPPAPEDAQARDTAELAPPLVPAAVPTPSAADPGIDALPPAAKRAGAVAAAAMAALLFLGFARRRSRR
ncbi:MAG TPA: YihY/virulence factor BrkB family protein [Egibacteraceae bacterium]|nr:YihY/virulence factor BrkB family protein [Egibacteraceae bacterium]